MNNLKKMLALLLCAVMTLSLLAGCTGGNGDTEATGNGELPEDVTLTIGIPQSSAVNDYDLNAYTLWLEEQTGYDLEFRLYQATSSDYKSQLSVSMVDGEELPDILMNFTLGSGVFNEYGEDGYFINLAPYFNDKEGKAKVWWERYALLDEDYQESIWNEMINDDGQSIYVFPTVETSVNDTMQFQPLINQEWLTKLNLEMPTDPESLYEVLKAFKTQDPNGNGKADEIPLIGMTATRTFDVVNWLINMFVYNSDTWRWKVDANGKVYNDFASEEYREALIYINKLVREELLSSASWTASNNTLKGLMAPGDGVATVGICVGRPTSVFTVNDPTIYAYAAMPYWGNAALGEERNHYSTFITEDCAYPDAAWNLLMLMSSEESAYRLRYGEKGVDWDDADEGAVSFNGEPANIKLINPGVFSSINNACWHTVVSTICINAENEDVQVEEGSGAWDQQKLKLMGDIYENFYAAREKTVDNTIRNLRYTEQEKAQTQAERDNTNAWIKECRASFCTGEGTLSDPSDDAQWQSYVDGLKQNGMETWQEQVQAIYDRTK